MASASEVAALVVVIGKAYPSFEADKERVALFVEMLSDLDTDALKAAIRQHIAVSKWPPTIAELRDMCATITRPALPAWSDAWEETLDKIRTVGSYGSPAFSHPLIRQTVQGMGGWQTMCQMEIGETATWRAQFRDIYTVYATRATQTANLLPSVRAVAEQYGALPAPDETPLALPNPEESRRVSVDGQQPIKFAQYMAQWRAEGRQKREEVARRLAAEGESHVQTV